VSGAQHRLAVYGSLAPGRHNHDQLEGISGTWVSGHVRGSVIDIDWGADAGYPGFILDPDGPPVPVMVLESPQLGEHWDRLDAFEGPGYVRIVVDVVTDAGTLQAHIYALRWPAQRGRPAD
jgi:gamma-glutamylcyclotransferase (GGCT)/AIG2-like uncharacterized protein YtfP